MIDSQVTGVHIPKDSVQLIPKAANDISAGFPSPAEDYMEHPLDLNEFVTRHPEATFYVRVQGESMIKVGIRDHDVLVIDRAVEARSGQVVIASICGDFTVKRLKRESDRLFLYPENDCFDPIEVTEEMECKIWGVVTHVLHTLVPE